MQEPGGKKRKNIVYETRHIDSWSFGIFVLKGRVKARKKRATSKPTARTCKQEKRLLAGANNVRVKISVIHCPWEHTQGVPGT